MIAPRVTAPLAAWGGTLLLALACGLPWMQVPVGADDGSIGTLKPRVERNFRLACPALAALLIGWRVRSGTWGDGARRTAVVGFVGFLFFPYAAMVWDDRVAAQASWMQMQHENLTWLGGDLCTSAEFGDSPLKSQHYPVDPPRRLMIFRVPRVSSSFFALANMTDLADWLGYTEAFCQFCRRGWFAALTALGTIVIATCIVDRELLRTRTIRTIKLLVVLAASGTLIAWTLPWLAGWHVSEAERLVRRGATAPALEHLERAVRYMPALRHDTSYVAQIGRLHHASGRDSTEAQLYLAVRFEAEGRFADALDRYRDVMHRSGPEQPARREACRALLRDAVHALNAGRVNAAEQDLREVLRHEPTNLKANFALQLIALRSLNRAELDELTERFARVYSFFQAPTKQAPLAACHVHRLAVALETEAPVDAWQAHRKALKP